NRGGHVVRLQSNSSAQHPHRFARGSQLQIRQGQAIVRFARELILAQRLLVHDGGFFVLRPVEKLVPVVDVVLGLHLRISVAGGQHYQQQQRQAFHKWTAFHSSYLDSKSGGLQRTEVLNRRST